MERSAGLARFLELTCNRFMQLDGAGHALTRINAGQISSYLPPLPSPALSFLPQGLPVEGPGDGPEEVRVTVWRRADGKTLSGNAAPRRKSLVAWLAKHPDWEEKDSAALMLPGAAAG